MSYAVVTLKKGEGRTLKAGGAWVFDNEIESITGGFTNGSIVLVHDFDGYPMGRGFINQNSKIRVRMMTRDVHQEIDEAFLRMRVKNAWEYRKTTVDTSSCRLIFGEADFLPGLTVDKYEDVGSSHPFPLILCSCFFILIFHIHLNVEKSTVAIEKTIAHSGFFYDLLIPDP